MQTNNSKKGKVLKGIIVSDKMKDTVVVKVDVYKKHAKYGKFVKRGKKFKAHCPGGTRAVGEKVTIRECAPISKDKHFVVV